MARETVAHVLVVHHASDAASTRKPCPRKRDMQGKLSALPELIITCGMTDSGQLHVACVKNRHAPADADAGDHFPMNLNAATSFVGDYIAIPRAYAWGNQGEEWG